jgi:hypothetical protein
MQWLTKLVLGQVGRAVTKPAPAETGHIALPTGPGDGAEDAKAEQKARKAFAEKAVL